MTPKTSAKKKAATPKKSSKKKAATPKKSAKKATPKKSAKKASAKKARGKSASPKRSPSKSKSPSKSRSPSPKRSNSASPARSRSRSRSPARARAESAGSASLTTAIGYFAFASAIHGAILYMATQQVRGSLELAWLSFLCTRILTLSHCAFQLPDNIGEVVNMLNVGPNNVPILLSLVVAAVYYLANGFLVKGGLSTDKVPPKALVRLFAAPSATYSLLVLGGFHRLRSSASSPFLC